MDRYFEFQETPVDRQYRLAKVKMIKIASTWLEGLQRQREREGKPRINTWVKLKKYLRRKYVPPTYRQQLFVQFNTLTQGTKTVQEYVQEWEKLVNDDEELRVGKFISGLREEIRRKIIYTPDLTLHSAINRAIEIEKNMSKKKTTGSTPYGRTTRTYTPKSPSINMVPRRDIPSSSQKAPPRDTMRTEVPPKEIVCFKCNGRGHYKRDCPNARAFTMREWEEIRQDTRPKKILVAKNGQEEEI